MVRIVSSPNRITGKVRARRERPAIKPRRQRQLTNALQLPSLGILAAAHDLRNLLTGIGMLADLLVLRLPEGEDRRRAEEISRASRSSQELLRAAMATGSAEHGECTASLSEVLGGMTTLLKEIAGANVALTLSAGEQMPVELPATEIYRIVLNLVLNAHEAMPEGGELVIETARQRLNAKAARRWRVAAGDYASLVVRDTGCGMASGTRARACEPFFTTRPGQGTGLGLTTVNQLAVQSGGALHIHSRPGKGTTVTVLLPIAANVVHTGSSERQRARGAAEIHTNRS